MEKFGGYKTEANDRRQRRERPGLRKKVEGENHLRYIREVVREETGMKTYLHGPMDYAKTLKLQFRAGDLDLSGRRKRYTSSREKGDGQMSPCSKAKESRNNIVGEQKKIARRNGLC